MRCGTSPAGFKTTKRGFALIEAVVAAAVCLALLLGVATALTAVLTSALGAKPAAQAAYLEEEGLEAARILRDNGWTANIASKTSGTKYYLAFDGATWLATTTDAYVDGAFDRAAIFSGVERDASQNIVASGGIVDPNTKEITVSVSWQDRGATTTRSLSTYLTNIFNN